MRAARPPTAGYGLHAALALVPARSNEGAIVHLHAQSEEEWPITSLPAHTSYPVARFLYPRPRPLASCGALTTNRTPILIPWT